MNNNTSYHYAYTNPVRAGGQGGCGPPRGHKPARAPYISSQFHCVKN